MSYFGHLMRHSSKFFHHADFVCVAHNMFERQRMVSNSYLRTSDTQAESFATITDKQIQDAIKRHLENAQGSGPSDQFLRKMKAVASSMGHTAGAARKARQNMLAMIAKFGLPNVMFTITPEDAVNFRLRVMVNKKVGEAIPPNPATTSTLDQQEFILDCARIRQIHPGMCGIDFENVIAITIEHLLGWDMKKRMNKIDEGLFGDLLAWCDTVEEQGRKTLHDHFLLWLLKWSKLLKGLANQATREHFSKLLVDYASKVMSTHMHGETIPPCVNDACVSRAFHPCSKQDIRNLRTKIGVTSLGGKSIVRCANCNTAMTSEALVLSRLKNILPAMAFQEQQPQNDPMAQASSFNVPLTNSMELFLMRQQILHPKRMTTDGTFVLTVLLNLHRSKHAISCFKKGDECRMHIPCAECEKTELKFSEDSTKWFDWKGNDQSRQLFTLEANRKHHDAFVNIHNCHASQIFGCNTNVVTAVDGGSVMYMTCYISKNTQEEDSSLFTNAAKQMIQKMRERLLELEQTTNSTEIETVEQDRETSGMRALIGAMLLSTSAHICSAPMASYLVQNNGSRFRYSHDFAYVNLKNFEKATLQDLSLDLIDGNTFLTSDVANYLFCPEELEDVCSYDFLSNFTVTRKTSKSLEWIKEHPSKDHLGVTAAKHTKISLVTYKDFVDTKYFGNRNIETEEMPDDILHEEHHYMELYAKKANILFHSFRSFPGDLTKDGSFVKCFQAALQSGMITAEHRQILANIQDCRNSLNSGRPVDPLEKETQKPTDNCCVHDKYDNENDEDSALHKDFDSAFEELIETVNDMNEKGLDLRSPTNIYQIPSCIIRKCGTSNCGIQNIVTPVIDEDNGFTGNVLQLLEDTSASHVGLESTPETSFSHHVTKAALHELAISRTERITAGDGQQDIKAIGTLKNIREYAAHHFRDDMDQRYAFEAIISAFIVCLHDEANRNSNTNPEAMPTRKRRKLDNIQKTLQNVNRGNQFIAFLSGAGGSGKSHVIKTIVQYAKNLCYNLHIRYDKRTIVVTALTGAAAVGINGETTAMACALNRAITKEPEQWKNAYLLIVDEISFASKEVVDTLDHKLRQILQPDAAFGGIALVFAGDFTQLKPVKAQPLFLFKDFVKWYDWVHTFLELKTNHRFRLDPPWGTILETFRDEGPSNGDVATINTRVVGSKHGPTEKDIPPNVVYATKTNLDRAAINDAIFAKHLENTHSKDPNVDPPMHTICIKASNLKWKKAGTRNDYVDFNKASEDILYATCGEGHWQGRDNKRYDPLLKLYYGRPLCINENKDVESCIANGAMCEFNGVLLKQGVTLTDLEKILIDGYYVWSLKVTQIEGIKVKVVDGNQNHVVLLKPQTVTQQV